MTEKKLTLFNTIMGTYYSILHNLIMLFVIIILLFCNKLNYLLIVLFIVFLDGIAIIFFQDCPLSLTEKKHLGNSCLEIKQIIYQKLGIGYNCNHTYEYTLEVIINAICLIAIKILILILCDIFGINISNKLIIK